MFINFSNHPSINWSAKQIEEANKYGEVCDVPFPAVPPMATKETVQMLAEESARKILSYDPDCVMCQGEFSLAVAVIRRLQEANVLCVCACSDRVTKETILEDGTTSKTAVFEFCQFREYV